MIYAILCYLIVTYCHFCGLMAMVTINYYYDKKEKVPKNFFFYVLYKIYN